MTGIAISIVNDKGGVSKSTSSICLGTYFMNKGKKVAILDVDPRHTSLDWAQQASDNGLETPLMVGYSRHNAGDEINRLKSVVDYVITDGLSSFVHADRSSLITSIIKASNHILIPTEPNDFDLWAIAEFAPLIKQRQEITEGTPKTAIYGTKVRGDSNKDWQRFLENEEDAPFPILNNYLPLDVQFVRTTRKGSSPLALNDSSKAYKATLAWANEVEEFING